MRSPRSGEQNRWAPNGALVTIKSSRSSGTFAIRTLGSVVEDGWAAVVASSPVSAQEKRRLTDVGKTEDRDACHRGRDRTPSVQPAAADSWSSQGEGAL